jgi:hypothetical protein
MRERLLQEWRYRRWVLILLFFVALWALLLVNIGRVIQYYDRYRIDPYLATLADGDAELSLFEAQALAIRFHAMTEEIDASGWYPEATEERLDQWAHELLPMYAYEGVSERTRIPKAVALVQWREPFPHNKIGGRSDCGSYAVVNYRYFNEISDWYQRPYWIGILTHELAHVAQGPGVCAIYDSEPTENAAQIITFEVLASLANGGNRDAAYTLAHEIKGMAISAVRAMSTKAEYREFYQRLYPNRPDKWGRLLQSERYWARDPEQLQTILEKYNRQPLELIYRYRQDGVVYRLALPNETKSLAIDDLLYFMRHAEEMIGWHLDQEIK